MMDDIIKPVVMGDNPKPPVAVNDVTPAVIGKPAIIQVQGLTKHYQLGHNTVRVLHKTDFTVPDNSFTIIYGPSGSGKSTLLHILAGLDLPSNGTVEVLGQDLFGLTADERAHFRSQYVGLVYQTNYWVRSLSVAENVALPLLLSGLNHSRALKAAKDSLDQIGMAEFANSDPTVLSGGEQQRVSVARALVAQPKLLLADEPTGNLDSSNGQMVVDLLIKAWRQANCSVILVTHNMEYLTLSSQQLHILDGHITAHQGGYMLPRNLMDIVKAQMVKTPPENDGNNNVV